MPTTPTQTHDAPAMTGARVRALPPEDWGRLQGLPIAEGGLPDPALATILVAEIGDEIVGVWLAQTVVLLDGLWVAPPARRRSWVLWKLLTGMRQLLLSRGVAHSFAILDDLELLGLAGKAGFTKLPGDLCLLDLSSAIGSKGVETWPQ